MPVETETMRRLRQKQRLVYRDPDEQEEDEIAPRTFSVEEKLASSRYNAEFVLERKGSDITTKLFQETGFRTPMVIRDKSGLGLRVPSENFTVSDAKACVGSRRIIDVMDVLTQRGETMSMKEYVQYYEDKTNRERLLNVISLEFSHTKLENYVEQPKVVQALDWVDTAWPRYLKEMQSETTNVLEKMKYPKVQRYCLMSVGGCYTDFHIDMGGTSVWYHLLHGKKTFWLIPPTEENLRLYESWILSGKQGDVFFADKVKDCQRITLMAGWTFMIPTGWIHAVHTPEDSLVFGGNFLHIYNASMQLRVWQIESKTHVPSQFRYPFFTEMHWYVLERYVNTLLGRNHLRVPKEDEDGEAAEEEEDSEVSNSVVDSGSNSSELSCVSLCKNFSKPQVYLTRFELEGIRDTIAWLDSLAPTKKNVPKDIPYPAGLLSDAKQVLQEHSNDDPTLALNGECTLKWLQKRPAKKLKTTTTTYRKTGGGAGAGSNRPRPRPQTAPAHRRRRVRCRRCEPCTRTDCRECVFCMDMRKYGGPGVSKQSCMSRKCLAPVLPAVAECHVCNTGESKEEEDGEGELLECGICWEIHHALCFQQQYGHSREEGVINEDLPSSWECPKCVHNGMQGTSQARIPKAILEAKAQAQEEREESCKEEETEQQEEEMEEQEEEVEQKELKQEEEEEEKPPQSDSNSSHDPLLSPLKAPLRLSICHLSPQKPVLRVSPMKQEKPAQSATTTTTTAPTKNIVTVTARNRESPLSPMLSSLEKREKQKVVENEILQSGFQRVVDREPVLETLEKCLKYSNSPSSGAAGLNIRLPKIAVVRLDGAKRTVKLSEGNGLENRECVAEKATIQFDGSKLAEVWNRGVKRKISMSDVDAVSSSQEEEESLASLSSWEDEQQVQQLSNGQQIIQSNRAKRRRRNTMKASSSYTSLAAETNGSEATSSSPTKTSQAKNAVQDDSAMKENLCKPVLSTRQSVMTTRSSSPSVLESPVASRRLSRTAVRASMRSRTSSASSSTASSPASQSRRRTTESSAQSSPKNPPTQKQNGQKTTNLANRAKKRSPVKTSPCKVVLPKVECKMNQGVKVNSRGRMINVPTRFLE